MKTCEFLGEVMHKIGDFIEITSSQDVKTFEVENLTTLSLYGLKI